MNTLSFAQEQPPLSFGQNAIGACVVVHDSYGGHAYFGHNYNPGLVTNVNLQSFLVQSVLSLEYALLDSYLKITLNFS